MAFHQEEKMKRKARDALVGHFRYQVATQSSSGTRSAIFDIFFFRAINGLSLPSLKPGSH